MGATEKIFHESWYQIANQHIVLRSSVRIKRQLFRGKRWYVLHEPFTNQFFRLRPPVYDFIIRLGMNKTVEETWNWALEHNPSEAPSQTEIIDLLAQLHQANLLQYERAPDSVKLFERYKKRKRKLMNMTLLNIMFARIPLFDPDNLLKFLMPFIRLIIGPLGLAAWLVMIGIGVKCALDNFPALMRQSDGVLAPSNLALLYAGIVLIKVIHEFGHAFAVRRFGGEVHAMGVMLLVLTPLPYTDATASWAFRSKWQRIFVGAAGMIFELFVAAVAAVVWAATGEGLLHSLAYNMLFAASVTTLLFNINPLLRYDGYYMLSDWLDIPNLQQQAMQQLTYAMERRAFGKKNCTSPASSAGEAWFLGAYGVVSSVYRVFVFSGILLFISKKMLLLAVVMAVFFVSSWLVVPVVKFTRYLATNPGLSRVRGRAVRVCAGAVLAVFAVLDYLPFPYGFTAPGVLRALHYMSTVNPTAGRVAALGKPSGSVVEKGDTLLVLNNTELAKQRDETAAALLESRLEYAKALDRLQADLEPMEKRIGAYTDRLATLDRQISELTVCAQINGVWVAPEVCNFSGRWLPRGSRLGEVINPDTFYFACVVSQREISELFSQKARKARIRLSGQAETEIPVRDYTTIPMEQNQLPSPALGFLGGGDIEVVQGDSAGTRTTEPFYEVRAAVSQGSGALLLHGRTGKMKFSLGYKPLLWQGWRRLRQLLQKHYQI